MAHNPTRPQDLPIPPRPKSGKWRCPKCEAYSFATQAKCQFCGEPQPHFGRGAADYLDFITKLIESQRKVKP